MPYASSEENSRTSSRFPPKDRLRFHDATLNEILQERVVSSRGRRTPRGVKRKMSNFPIRPRNVKLPAITDVAQHIRILK